MARKTSRRRSIRRNSRRGSRRLVSLFKNSRRRTSLRRNSYTSTPAGKKVVMAFLDRRAASSAKLTTDGKRLDGTWMGGRGIAEWVGGKIVFYDLGSKSAQTVQNMVRREAPASWLKPNRRRGSMRRNPPIQFSDETRALAQKVYGK